MLRTIVYVLSLTTGFAFCVPDAHEEAAAAVVIPEAPTTAKDRESIIEEAIELAKQARKTKDPGMYGHILELLDSVDFFGNRDARIPFWQGVALRHLNKWEKAIERYRQADALSPGTSDILNDWGVTLQNLGRYPEAAVLFRKSIQADPLNSWSYNNLGTILDDLLNPA
jgi:tetratricopeptide (TPR) repeat protein